MWRWLLLGCMTNSWGTLVTLYALPMLFSRKGLRSQVFSRWHHPPWMLSPKRFFIHADAENGDVALLELVVNLRNSFILDGKVHAKKPKSPKSTVCHGSRTGVLSCRWCRWWWSLKLACFLSICRLVLGICCHWTNTKNRYIYKDCLKAVRFMSFISL